MGLLVYTREVKKPASYCVLVAIGPPAALKGGLNVYKELSYTY